MTRARRPLTALFLALLASLSWLPSADAQARPTVAAAVFSPRTGVLFNDPDGTIHQRHNILDYLAASVDSAPSRSYIRFAVYTFFDQTLADKLVAAKKRGVRVQVLVDGHSTSSQIEQLRAALGDDVRAKSFLTTCQYGCMSSSPASFMHVKIFLFSTSGRAKRVTMIGSGNPNPLGHDNGWNNQDTVVGNDALYLSNVKYFSDMVQDRTVPNYYRTTATAPYKAYFFPRAGYGAKYDTMYNVLTAVRCLTPVVGRAPRRTVVRVSMFLWTARRAAIARQLWRLHDRGCDVQVLYPSNSVEPAVVAALLKPSSHYGRMKVYDALRDRNRDGVFDSYVHSKYVVVDGVYGRDVAAAAVWAGSANFGGTGLREGNEVTLKISGRTVTSQYEANFAKMRLISKLVTTVPPAPKPSAGNRGGELDVRDDYGE